MKMVKNLVVIGAAGVGRQCLDIVDAMNASGTASYNVLGVYDDSPNKSDLSRLEERRVPYLGQIQDLLKDSQRVGVVLGIGYPAPRVKVLERLNRGEFIFPSIIDPKANLGSEVSIGKGVVIASGVEISTHTAIGDFTQINPGAIIGHDVQLNANVTINPGAIVSGDVTIGEASLVGAGAIVLQQLVIGEHSVIGAGAVVTKPVPMNTMVKGVPAK